MILIVVIIIFTSLHSSILVSAEGGNGTRFAHVQDKCYATDLSIWQPPLSKRASNKTVRALLGVESQRTCAVECAVDESCAAFQHFPDTNTCVFASACYFKFLWIKGENCSTQIVETRMKNDSQCYLADDFALVAAYNLRLGNLNLVNASQYEMLVEGAVFTEEGAEIAADKKLSIPTLANELPLSDLVFGYGKSWTICNRFKITSTATGYKGIFESRSCDTGSNFRVRIFIYSSSTTITHVYMYLNDRHMDTQHYELSAPSHVIGSDGWVEFSLVCNGTHFTLYLDGSLITQRNSAYDSAVSAADMAMNCTHVGRYNYGSHPLIGTINCLGIANTNLSDAQLATVFSNYCYT